MAKSKARRLTGVKVSVQCTKGGSVMSLKVRESVFGLTSFSLGVPDHSYPDKTFGLF